MECLVRFHFHAIVKIGSLLRSLQRFFHRSFFYLIFNVLRSYWCLLNLNCLFVFFLFKSAHTHKLLSVRACLIPQLLDSDLLLFRSHFGICNVWINMRNQFLFSFLSTWTVIAVFSMLNFCFFSCTFKQSILIIELYLIFST